MAADAPGAEPLLRPMTESDFDAVARLIHRSTNAWYESRFGHSIFAGPESDCRIFPETYHAIDPGEAIVVEDASTGELLGSCFVHPRPTHVGIGIVNVAPEAFGRGIARRMMDAAGARADAAGLPMRLVSSAMNLDSYSLYSRTGFVPRALFQDMLVSVPEAGLPEKVVPPGVTVLPATASDAVEMAALEHELAKIRRDVDIAHFLANPTGIWRTWVARAADGAMVGWLAASDHSASRIAGPASARDAEVLAALLWSALDALRGKTVLVLVPADCPALIRLVESWGGRNAELHVLQIRGVGVPPCGIQLPSFLPESG